MFEERYTRFKCWLGGVHLKLHKSGERGGEGGREEESEVVVYWISFKGVVEERGWRDWRNVSLVFLSSCH